MTFKDQMDTPRIDQHEADPTLVISNVPTSPSGSSSIPTSPSRGNPSTPERSDSPELAFDPAIVAAVNRYGSTEEEFPNPYDSLRPPPFPSHVRVHSVPDLSVFQLLDSQQQPQRIPSVLRPSHPKFMNSADSRRASLAISGWEFGSSPSALGDRPLSMHSSPTFHLSDEDGLGVPLRSYSATAWQPQRSSLSASHVLNESTNGDQDHDGEHNIEVSERFEESRPDEPPLEVQSELNKITRRPTDVWPTKAVSSKKSPRWKFWSRRMDKKQKA